MKKMLCFDMDGTIANLYTVDNWLGKLQNEDDSPYKDAEPMFDMNHLNTTLTELKNHGYEIRVISWLSKNSSEPYKKAVRQAKREWLKKYNFPVDKIHLVAYGTKKSNCVKKYTDNAILIDDDEKVRKTWNLGATINPTEGNLIQKLESLL